MNNPNDFLDPEFEPGEFEGIERRLRSGLATEANRIHPGDRLDAIIAGAHAAGSGPEPGRGAGPRRWLVPLAAAAAVAAIIGGVWWSGQDDGRTTTPPADTRPTVSPSPPVSPTPEPSVTEPPSTGTPTTPAPAQTQPASLPVYFVGPTGDDKPTYKLFREFIRGQVPKDPTDAEKAKASLVLAINAQPYSNTDGYLQPWSGQTIGDVRVTPDVITVDLADAGNPGAAVTEEIRRLAVQELVWTAQAAVGKGAIPVRFTVQGAQADLFGSISTGQTFNRPPSSEYWRDLAPIWITSPSRDQVLPATTSVVVKGEATVFEANVQWELKQGARVVTNGFTTASEGAPGRGQYSIDLGRLAAGDYTIRVFEMSMEGGDKVNAEKSVSFTMR